MVGNRKQPLRGLEQKAPPFLTGYHLSGTHLPQLKKRPAIPKASIVALLAESGTDQF